MKRILSLILVAVLALACFSCGNADDPAKKSEGVMTYAEYAAAALESEVTIEAYVQAKQGYWEKDGQGLATIYAQDLDGAYFIYDLKVTKADYDKMVNGTKLRVKGYKTEWRGEVEIIDATYEILEGSYIAEAKDVTALLGTDDLIKSQNMFVSFKGMTVEAIEYKNGQPGDDIYVTVSLNGEKYSFCVEVYLTGTETDVYKAVGELKAGDVVDIEGFLYWYEGVNTHITAVKAAA